MPTLTRISLRRLAAAALLVGAIAPAACTRNPKPDPNGYPAEAEQPTTIRVQNQSFLDVNVYVVRSGSRSRLGTVTGNSTAVLTIPRMFVQALTPLRFIADPIGGRRQPISEEITVSPGDEVGLIIPPGT